MKGQGQAATRQWVVKERQWKALEGQGFRQWKAVEGQGKAVEGQGKAWSRTAFFSTQSSEAGNVAPGLPRCQNAVYLLRTPSLIFRLTKAGRHACPGERRGAAETAVRENDGGCSRNGSTGGTGWPDSARCWPRYVRSALREKACVSQQHHGERR